MKPTNYVVIQGWMMTHLHLKGHALMLYAILYSFGQGDENAGFKGMDCDLAQFCENIIPRSSYYEARRKLCSAKLLQYTEGRFTVLVPDLGSPESGQASPEIGLNPSGNRTKTSPESGLTNNNVNNNMGNNTPTRNFFYDSDELLRRLREQRGH